MKTAILWLSIVLIVILAACDPPEPGGDLELLPAQPEISEISDLNLPPDAPVFMNSILMPQPGEVIHVSPYTLIYYGTSFGGIDHFEVWVDGGPVGVSPILGYSSGGPAYGHFFYSEYEWTPASQGDHTLAIRAVGAGINNFSEFMEVEVTVDILPSLALDTDLELPNISLLPDCIPADLEAPALISPEHYVTLSDDFDDWPATLDWFQWASLAGCIPDEYTLRVSVVSFHPTGQVRMTEGSTTSWPSDDGSLVPFFMRPASQYNWTVFASADGVDGPSAPARSFFTGPLCASPQDLGAALLFWPVDERVASPHVLLQWGAGFPLCLPDGYHVDLQTDPEFNGTPLGSLLSSPETNWMTPELEDCTTYYWRVAALKDGFSGPFLEVQSFHTDFDGTCPVLAEEGPWVEALIDQACYVGPDPAKYPIAGYLVMGETAPLVAQDLSGMWWVVENQDADGTCFVRKLDNEASGDTSGLATWDDPEIGAACTQDMDQDACSEAGGNWVDTVGRPPYCACP